MKIIISAVLLMMSGQAFSIGDAVINKAIETVGEVAKEAINANKSEVKVKDSTLVNSVDMNEAVSIGNTGISITGDKVLVQDATIVNKVKLRRAVNVGNAGIQLGK